MKPLKPSMRENKRYLLIRGENLRENIEKAILEFIGILGMSKTGLFWVKEGNDWAVIAINREAVNNVRASFSVYKERIEVIRVSGTIKGLKIKNKPRI